MTEEDFKLKNDWHNLRYYIQKQIGKKPSDLNGMLFLIGMQELGQGTRDFTKEQKQDLMHIATCKVLSYGGFYTLEGVDAEGWPHWKNILPLPHIDLLAQENLLRHYVVEYFINEQDFDPYENYQP
jgi:hypothetical protein